MKDRTVVDAEYRVTLVVTTEEGNVLNAVDAISVKVPGIDPRDAMHNGLDALALRLGYRLKATIRR